jgi:tetratricopeptide (TPR) repeat protein
LSNIKYKKIIPGYGLRVTGFGFRVTDFTILITGFTIFICTFPLENQLPNLMKTTFLIKVVLLSLVLSAQTFAAGTLGFGLEPERFLTNINQNEPDTGIIKTFMYKGDSMMQEGYYLSAIIAYSSVITINPEHYHARLNRVNCYMYISDFTKAKADINYLIRHNNKDHSLTKIKAKILYSMGDIIGAEVSLDIYVDKVPDDPEGWYLLGLMDKKSKRYGNALYHLDKANNLYGGDYYEALTVMGNVYKEKKEYMFAEEYYRLATRADSTKGLPYYQLGNIRLIHYDTLSAIGLYDTAIRVNVNDHIVAQLVTESLLEIGYIDLAISRYVMQIKADPTSSEAWSNLGVFYLYAEKYPEALDCFNHALMYAPDQSQLLYYKGIALIGMNNEEEGRQFIMESAKMGNFHAQQYLAYPTKKGISAGLQTWVIALQVMQLLKL